MVGSVLGGLGVVGAGLGLGLAAVRRRGMDRWLAPYLAQAPRRRLPRRGEPVHVLLCLTDHFEPNWYASPAEADARMGRWSRELPRRFGGLRDSDGRPPQHSFFYPLEEYQRRHLDALADLCRAGFGEVEVHLHHDNETADSLRARLLEYKELLARRHGLLARDRHTGAVRYAFIHGNWCLCNSRPDRRWCGVDNELSVLHETGCYADFTFPSAPDRTQPRKVNSLYYAWDGPGRPRPVESGVDAGRGRAPENSLLLIQGPLLLDWGHRKWGLLPRVENACVQRGQLPTMRRLDLWLRARVQVPARPDWFFVKLHTHGAHGHETDDMLLGEPRVRFYEELARRADADPNFHVHYVTAREMYNLVRAAEAGWEGSVQGARDFELVSNCRAGEALPAAGAPGRPCAAM